MRFNLKKTLAGAAAIAVVATVAPFVSPGVASAATNNGGAVVNPPGGGAAATTPFQIVLPPGAACPGDSASASAWRVHSFIAPASANLDADLSFLGTGSPAPVAGQIRANLFRADTLGFARNFSTDLAVPPAVTGQISGLPSFTLSPFAPGFFPDGAYRVGLACVPTGGTPPNTTANTFYWSKLITLTNPGGNLTWANGAAAVAPTVIAPTLGGPSLNGNGQVTVAFTPGASDPAVPAGGFTATATPPVGPAITATGSGSPIVIPGLTNGTTYAVTVSANNGVGSPAVSAPVNFTPTLPLAPPVTNLNAVGSPAGVTVTWTPAASGPTPTGYSVAVTSGALPGTPVAGSPFTVPFGTNTFTQTGPAGTAFNFTVTPTFPAPQLGTSAGPVSGAVQSAQVLNQVITTTRPNGALVLTQVCGRYGTLDAEPAQLGFPTGIPLAGPVNDGDNPNPVLGTAPYLTQSGVPLTFPGANPDVATSPAGPQDGQFPGYPYPDDPTTGEATPTYPTWCGIELGAARFVGTGDPAFGQGQFYAAAGRMNQVTVVDTRDTDPGFNIAGQVTDFTAPGGKVFSGNQLGWTPRVNRDTGPFTDALGNTYNQTVVAGPGSVQNNPVGLTAIPAPGAANANTLVTAAARAGTAPTFTGGLGIAVMDARLKLAIPVTALSGNYTAVLTISAI